MPPSFDLNEKTIIVTGASSGIGRSIAAAIAEAGGKVLLLARDEERLAETASLCQGRGMSLSVDLSDLDALPKLVRLWAKEYGTFSGLVHSAGMYQNLPLRAVRANVLMDMFALNALAGVMLIKGLSHRDCLAKSGASVVLLSSVMGHVGQPGLLGYCMSKGAVEQAVKVLALELQSENIRVNAIAPASIQTPMTDRGFSVLSEEQRQNILGMHPKGMGKPEDVVGAAIYLLSDASRYVTGTSLLVDGGYCAQ